jgi:hypothetical protein
MNMTELVTSTALAPDGITGHTDAVDGQETKQSSLFRGTRIKFGKTAEWEIKGGEIIDSKTRLIFIDVARIVTKWGADKKPVETIVLEPGEKFPDVAAWNDKLPHTEWIMGLNGLRGPWQTQQIVYFLDPRSMAQFHWPDGTTGGSIAISEAVDSIRAMRRFRPGAAPIVELSSTFMNTKFGGRQRPSFVIHSWVSMPGKEPQQPAALPTPAAPTVTGESITIDAVEPVSLAEELSDSIPF